MIERTQHPQGSEYAWRAWNHDMTISAPGSTPEKAELNLQKKLRTIASIEIHPEVRS